MAIVSVGYKFNLISLSFNFNLIPIYSCRFILHTIYILPKRWIRFWEILPYFRMKNVMFFMWADNKRRHDEDTEEKSDNGEDEVNEHKCEERKGGKERKKKEIEMERERERNYGISWFNIGNLLKYLKSMSFIWLKIRWMENNVLDVLKYGRKIVYKVFRRQSSGQNATDFYLHFSIVLGENTRNLNWTIALICQLSIVFATIHLVYGEPIIIMGNVIWPIISMIVVNSSNTANRLK